jgi:hypothetical protein
MIKLNVKMTSQPDITSCGPTALFALYQFWGDRITLPTLISEVEQFDEGGGTLAVVLGKHAVQRGYKVKIYSYNINIFDPTWFKLSKKELCLKLSQTLEDKGLNNKKRVAVEHYLSFLKLGGALKFEDLKKSLIRKFLHRQIPVLTGLSSTWLYKTMREVPSTNIDDDILGKPAGHFVVLYGYHETEVFVADPHRTNPITGSHYYTVHMESLVNAILLGIISYDGNLLIIEKKK